MQGLIMGCRGVLCALSALAIGYPARPGSAEAQAVPYSAGTERPNLVAPSNATDCHLHICDSRYPADPRSTLRPPDATVADSRKLQQRLGRTKHVVVQPSTYGSDNRDVTAAFGPTGQGIAGIDEDLPDAELKRLDGLGIRGIRVNVSQLRPQAGGVIEALSKRVNDLGWHVQIGAPDGAEEFAG